MDEKLEFKLTSYSLMLISEVVAKSKRDYTYYKETNASLFKKNWFQDESIEESNQKKCEIIASNIHLMQIFIFQFPKDFDDHVDIRMLMKVKTRVADDFFEYLNASFDLQSFAKFVEVNTRHNINDLIDWLPLIPFSFRIYKKRINDYPRSSEVYPGIDLVEFSKKVYWLVFKKDCPLNGANVEGNMLFSNGIKITNSFCVDIAKQQAIIDSK